MRIAVISDSHRNSGIIRKIIFEQPLASHIFFLGDFAGDADEVSSEFPDRVFHILSGNCDYFSVYPSSDTDIIEGQKIFYTHGHTLGVKYGTGNLLKTAKENNCNIALYGHTHCSQILYEDGIYIVNPGSCSEPRNGGRSYAVIDIMEKGILPAIINL